MNTAEMELFGACTRGEGERVRELLRGHVDVNWGEPFYQRTPLIRSCFLGHVAIVRMLLEDPRTKVNQLQSQGCTPFYLACQMGHVEVVSLLLADPRIDVTHPMNGGFSPLNVTCHQGHVEVVRQLVEDGRNDVNQPDDRGGTPFFAACQAGHTEVVRYLCAQDRQAVDVNYALGDGTTALAIACQMGHVEVVELLLERQDVDVNLAMKNGATPLFLAAQDGFDSIVKRLLLKRGHLGLDLGATWMGITPAKQASLMGHGHVVTLLEDFQRDPFRTRALLKRECGLAATEASEFLAMMVLMSDEYLQPKEGEAQENPKEDQSKQRRFLQIGKSLPFDLQMLLSNRTAFLPHDVIPPLSSERALKKVLAMFS